MLSNKTVEEVKNIVSIEDIVKDYVQIKRSGKNFVCCCPFHKERTPSFFIFPNNNCFKCFGCGEAGDAIAFIQKIENVDFIEAIELLANKYGIRIEYDNKNDEYQNTDHQKKESAFIILEYVRNYFQNNLKNSINTKKYLESRKINETTINKFHLGYSDISNTNLLENIKKLNYDLDICKEIGLVHNFKDRLIIPLRNHNGKTIGFAGRILNNDNTEAKYINSHESFIFHKSKTLFGLYNAKNAIRENQKCYLVEGYFDVISLVQNGIENVVASCGTSLTDEQCVLLHRFTNCVSIFYDSDSAGIKATERAIEKLLQHDFLVNVVDYSSIKDPDELTKGKSPEELKYFLSGNEIDFVSFLCKNKSNEDINDKTKNIHKIKDFVKLVKDDVYRKILLKKIKDIFDIEIKIIPVKEKQQITHVEEIKNDPIESYELELLRFFIVYGDEKIDNTTNISDFLINKFSEFDFINDNCKKIRDVCIDLAKQKKLTVKNILNTIEDKVLQSIVINLTIPSKQLSEQWFSKLHIDLYSEKMNLQKSIEKNILYYQIQILHKIIKETEENLKNTNDEKIIENILQKISILKQKEIAISKGLGFVVF